MLRPIMFLQMSSIFVINGGCYMIISHLYNFPSRSVSTTSGVSIVYEQPSYNVYISIQQITITIW